MYVHDTHMPQLLAADAYRSPEQHRAEFDRLFRRAWHFVGSMAELPNEGDYFTYELFGRPIVVWRTEGEVKTFLNVCPHRFSIVRADKSGFAGERLKCGYHGWEFDRTGNTRKIPDARSFRPLEQGMLCLTPFRTEVLGQLIFVSLAPDGPDLAEFLGPYRADLLELFPDFATPMMRLDYDIDANWKIKIENTLEDYHLDEVHKATFGHMPPHEGCVIELPPHGSFFSAIDKPREKWQDWIVSLFARLCRTQRDDKYRHYIVHPHLMFAKLQLGGWVEVCYPISPTRSRVILRTFFNPGRPLDWRSKIVFRLTQKYFNKFGPMVAREDEWIIDKVQRGLNAEAKPNGGLISVREERVFHFQEYLKRNVTDEALAAAGEEIPAAPGARENGACRSCTAPLALADAAQ